MENIYLKGARDIGSFHRREVLDYIDALLEVQQLKKNKDAIDCLEKVKTRILKSLGQSIDSYSLLITTLLSGGKIEPFGGNDGTQTNSTRESKT